MSIHVGTTDSPVVCSDSYDKARWSHGIAQALRQRPRLTGGDTGGVYYCGQAAWNLWVLPRKTKHELRDERWEWLDKIATNLRDIGRGWGDPSVWCETGEDVPF